MAPDEAAEAAIPFIYAPGTPRADIDADLAVRAAHPTDPVGYAATGPRTRCPEPTPIPRIPAIRHGERRREFLG